METKRSKLFDNNLIKSRIFENLVKANKTDEANKENYLYAHPGTLMADRPNT